MIAFALAATLACVPSDGTWQPMIFGGAGTPIVASLVYDEERALCRVEGDMDAAFRMLWADYYDQADRLSRLRFGDAQVDAWNRAKRRR